MHRRRAVKLIAGLMVCPLCAGSGLGTESHHWTYDGETGPTKWGGLDPANVICSAGSQESPIDIVNAISARLAPLEVRWRKQANTIINNGHTIQLNFAPGNTLKAGNRSYSLAQFHFHHPSEHLVEGEAFAMEAHFVHIARDGGYAVIGVLLVPGRHNAVFNKIVTTMRPHEGPPQAADPMIDPNRLLPRDRTYFQYEGSLTTPPCSESVDLFVLANTVQVAEDDIARFGKLYPMNARPVQKRERRFIVTSKRP